MADELTWDPPGAGVWWLVRDHFPVPVSGLFAAIFPAVTRGWETGGARYGLPTGAARWAAVNGWMYYAADDPGTDPAALDRLEAAARDALATRSWRAEVDRWFGIERPATIAANRALEAVDLGALDDAGLAAHIDAAFQHFDTVAPLHFEHLGFDVAGGLLFAAAAEWSVDPSAVVPLLAGASPASAAASAHVDRIAAALAAAGVDALAGSATLTDVRAVGQAVAAAVDDYLAEYGWQLLGGNDLAEPALAERPDVLVASIRARMTRPSGGSTPAVDAVASALSDDDRERFGVLLADARLTYELRDDDNSICFSWPLGLIRRAVLEAGRRLAAAGAVGSSTDLFEATPAEIDALLNGGQSPSAVELAARANRRQAALAADPPAQFGQWKPSPDVAWPEHVASMVAARGAYWGIDRSHGTEDAGLRGTGVGDGVYQGPACVVAGSVSIAELEPGDVLVALATTAAHNVVFPIAGAVVTEEGGLFSHAAILARELGLPAVVGVAGALRTIGHGDSVEVDARTGRVRVVTTGASDREPAQAKTHVDRYGGTGLEPTRNPT